MGEVPLAVRLPAELVQQLLELLVKLGGQLDDVLMVAAVDDGGGDERGELAQPLAARCAARRQRTRRKVLCNVCHDDARLVCEDDCAWQERGRRGMPHAVSSRGRDPWDGDGRRSRGGGAGGVEAQASGRAGRRSIRRSAPQIVRSLASSLSSTASRSMHSRREASRNSVWWASSRSSEGAARSFCMSTCQLGSSTSNIM